MGDLVPQTLYRGFAPGPRGHVMKAVPYIPICQEMLLWQPNNVG